jgi:hypothetical protein
MAGVTARSVEKCVVTPNIRRDGMHTSIAHFARRRQDMAAPSWAVAAVSLPLLLTLNARANQQHEDDSIIHSSVCTFQASAEILRTAGRESISVTDQAAAPEYFFTDCSTHDVRATYNLDLMSAEHYFRPFPTLSIAKCFVEQSLEGLARVDKSVAPD